MNAAQTIRQSMGIAIPDLAPDGAGKFNPKHTKSGPGRRHVDGDGSRTSKQKQAGAYGRGLRNWINRKQTAK